MLYYSIIAIGKVGEAIVLFRSVVEMQRNSHEQHHVDVANASMNLGVALSSVETASVETYNEVHVRYI